MPLNSELVGRLRDWVLAGAKQPGLSAADLDPLFTFENGAFHIEAPHAAAWVSGQSEGLVDVTLDTEATGNAWFSIVVRGGDPVTDLCHQSAWLFEIRNERVRRLVETTSGQLTRRPYDGTVPLREVGD